MQNALENAVEHWSKVAPVVDTPTNPEEYELLMAHLKGAIELSQNRPNSALSSLIKMMTRALEEYETSGFAGQHGGGLQALRYLIKLHGIKQSHLKEIGSQGVVSEVLNGKRSLTLKHIQALSRRFKVSPSTFIDAEFV